MKLSTIRRSLVVAAAALSIAAGPAALAAVKTVTGAGSTFAYPLYSKWASAYAKKTGFSLNYQSIGSGGGIRQIEHRTVTFGASDAPLKPATLQKHNLMQFPTAVGGAIPTMNLPGIQPGEIKLSGKVLADIYLGKITKWNDPAIKQLNPNVKLPDTRITVVHRSDGSGTTWIWTNYLSKVSPEWKKKLGFSTSVPWPTGVGAKGNEGVASYVQRIKGAIGYNEYAYVLENHMTYARMINKAGKAVSPSSKTFQAAAANANWTGAKDFYVVLTDQPGDDTWPISGATFVLLPTQSKHPEEVKAAMTFFDWGFKHGDKLAQSLDYVPMPASVVKVIEQAWHDNIKNAKGEPIWSTN